jgi:hypothetical protein
MQFSSEVNWSFADFLVMGTLLLAVALSVEAVLRKFPKRSNRMVLIAVTILIFLIIWTELAVGIIGTPLAGS